MSEKSVLAEYIPENVLQLAESLRRGPVGPSGRRLPQVRGLHKESENWEIPQTKAVRTIIQVDTQPQVASAVSSYIHQLAFEEIAAVDREDFISTSTGAVWLVIDWRLVYSKEKA